LVISDHFMSSPPATSIFPGHAKYQCERVDGRRSSVLPSRHHRLVARFPSEEPQALPLGKGESPIAEHVLRLGHRELPGAVIRAERPDSTIGNGPPVPRALTGNIALLARQRAAGEAAVGFCRMRSVAIHADTSISRSSPMRWSGPCSSTK